MLTESTVTFVALGAIFAFSFYAVLVAGQLSLGQAGFASLAAFTAVGFGPDPRTFGELPALFVAGVIGMAVGAVIAVVLGLPTMHLRGVFLAIATLGFAEAIRIVLLNFEWTGGALGTNVPKILTPQIAWLVVSIVAYWFWRQAPSRYGRALAAIREDEIAASSMGIDVGRHRLAAFVTSGAIAGLYGVLWAHYVRLIAPDDFSFSAAIDGLVTAVVGGSTMFIGPFLGSAFQTVIPEAQRSLGVEAGWIRPFTGSALLLVVILFLPGGLASLLGRVRPHRSVRRTVSPAAGGASGSGERLGRSHPNAGSVIASLVDVSKEYGGVKAVQGVSMELRAGQIVGLIGPNGAGKTTLVNIISGLVTPDGGTVTVLGHRPGKSAVHKIASSGLSRTFQHSKLFNRLTAFDNVLVGAHVVCEPTFARRLLWLPSARRDERSAADHALRCLERVGLAGVAANLAGSLSYGDQRRLEIARALASDPTLLILDEPAAGMNHMEAQTLSDLIRSLAGDGLTILFIEHNVGMVLGTCDHIEVLDFGRVIASGSPTDIQTSAAVRDAYLGSPGDEPDTNGRDDTEERVP